MVTKANEIGYCHFDGAQIYGLEKECGRAINEAIAKGTVIRQDLFIVSKVFCRKFWEYLLLQRHFILSLLVFILNCLPKSQYDLLQLLY